MAPRTRTSVASGVSRHSDPSVSSVSVDPVAAYQELAKVKRGLPRRLVSEIERRKATSIEDAARVANALRAKRTKSHKVVKANGPGKAKGSKPKKPGEFLKPSDEATLEVIAGVKRALDSGVIKL
ncbi:hypothetical protein BBOV_II006425 [Babesia bovis T2Bo]|uniref:hypothetical protein n=1 Tax=Babesia bovis T2Bo TaxID=484906 RepID=UPI001C34DD8E|nr:hypothetical protein BBOV_II006425 [Babesia bovis T2Bo]KAG6440110.1 hypothetical protein BBOV_II006425 [Babesia bovis T2Bo]